MPMDQDPAQGGTNADGSKSTVYCSYCYENGQFHDDFQSPAEMVRFVKGKLKEMGVPWYKRWLYTSHIPQLGRWKESKMA